MSELPAISRLRTVYIGARVVGYRCLRALLQAGANIVRLLSLDDQMAEATTAFRSFDDLIAEYKLSSRKFRRLNTPDLIPWVCEAEADLGIVIGVSQLVPLKLLQQPRLGFIGMHPTLLPQGRGRAPIPWALIKGLTKTGVSLFYCDAGADTGDLVAQAEVPIYYHDTSATLGARTDDFAIELLLESLTKLGAGTAARISQDEGRATVWPRRRPEDGVIDWARSQRELYDWVRALTHPYPGAFTYCRDRRLWIWAASESYDGRSGEPGEVLENRPQGVLVATGNGNLLVTLAQLEHLDESPATRVGLRCGERLGTAA
ncbi:MAG: methionyl-tRNA formyltransferase [Planctomycetes bacterium]|nr:methionyl-tRNA formyltransferase [Planctomycetota bacterium]